MVVLKAVTVILAGLITAVAVRTVVGQMQAAKVRARPSQPNHRSPVRLRQDPRTGVYYPES